MTLRQVRQAHTRWLVTQHREREERKRLRLAVQIARETHTLAEIGEVLGMTRQGVHDLLKRNDGR